MWDIFLTVLEQLGNTFRWGIVGFFIGIFIIFLLRKSKILKGETFFQLTKIAIYYIIFPIGIGSLFWLYAATKHVEKDVHQIANKSINQIENSLYPSFNKYITRYLKNYVDVNNVPTNDEIVSNFLNENKESSWFTTEIMHWSLVKSLEYSEKQALKQMGISPNDKDLNVLLLANQNHQLEKGIYDLPFKKIRGLTYNQIGNYLKQFYLLYYLGFGLLFVIILLEFISSLLKK